MVSRRSLLSAIGVSAVAGRPRGVGAQPRGAGAYRLVRDIPVDEGYDLVVAGGGPAGAAAAICAARLGAKVLLAEATGCMGGMGTSGLVTAFAHTADGQRMLVGGFMREVIETLYQRGFLKPGTDPDTWRKKFHQWVFFDGEGYKLLLDELATKAGVEVRFFTRVIDTHADRKAGKVDGVVLQNIEGYRYVRARTFVDATGDAVLAELCGALCREAGHGTPMPMAPTLCSMCSGIDYSRFHGDRQQQAVEQAVKAGFFKQPDLHLPGLFQTGKAIGLLNAGHLFGLDALRSGSLSDGMMWGRRMTQEYIEFYRKYVTGCEKMEHVTTAALLGVRESRRILGEYELNTRDYMARRQFPDQIAVHNGSMDIHPRDASPEEYERYYTQYNTSGRLKPGECFGIPYGVLVPKGWKNLWVAGRPVSADVEVHGAIRVQSAAGMMGQAAGTAAVQSFRTNRPADEIDAEVLITTLRKAGAFLPQQTTTKRMTRSA